MTGVRNLIVALSLAMQAQMLTGNELLKDIVKLRQDLAKWLSPPDPFVNFNTADHARHQGTAEWFTQSSVFKNWKESSSFLWIHGKRTSPSPIAHSPLLISVSTAGSGKSVLTFVFVNLSGLDNWLILSTIDQLCDHPGHQACL